jgi:hypothetical protein
VLLYANRERQVEERNNSSVYPAMKIPCIKVILLDRTPFHFVSKVLPETKLSPLVIICEIFDAGVYPNSDRKFKKNSCPEVTVRFYHFSISITRVIFDLIDIYSNNNGVSE